MIAPSLRLQAPTARAPAGRAPPLLAGARFRRPPPPPWKCELRGLPSPPRPGVRSLPGGRRAQHGIWPVSAGSPRRGDGPIANPEKCSRALARPGARRAGGGGGGAATSAGGSGHHRRLHGPAQVETGTPGRGRFCNHVSEQRKSTTALQRESGSENPSASLKCSPASTAACTLRR